MMMVFSTNSQSRSAFYTGHYLVGFIVAVFACSGCITKAVPSGDEFEPLGDFETFGSTTVASDPDWGTGSTTIIPVESDSLEDAGSVDETDDVAEVGEEDPEPKFDLNSFPDVEIDPNQKCNIDFLFVIDNSGSMANEQRNVANSVPGFIDTISSEIPNLESYHLGVITTDENDLNGIGTSCAQMGGLTVQTVDSMGNLRDCGPYRSGANYMDQSDDLLQSFECAANVGISGSVDERPFDAIQSALGPALKTPGGCNEGFLRPNSVLVVVLITDEEDDHLASDVSQMGSVGGPEDWYRNLLSVKDDRPEYLVMLSLIGTDPPNSCNILLPPGQGSMLTSDGAELAPRIREFTEMFAERGVVGDVCASDYDPFFDSAVEVLKSACASIPEG